MCYSKRKNGDKQKLKNKADNTGDLGERISPFQKSLAKTPEISRSYGLLRVSVFDYVYDDEYRNTDKAKKKQL